MVKLPFQYLEGFFTQQASETSEFARSFKNSLFENSREGLLSNVDPFLIFEKKSRTHQPPFLFPSKELAVIRQSSIPVLLTTQGQSFNPIRRLFFIDNAPQLSDHPFLHQIISSFLPRAFHMEEHDVHPIHWNNVFQLPYNKREKYELRPEQLNALLRDHDIHLIVMPLGYHRTWWKTNWENSFLAQSDIPILVFPKGSGC